MGRRRRRAAAVIGAAAVGGLVHAGPAGAAEATEQHTFTHTSGQRITCSWVHEQCGERDWGNCSTGALIRRK